MTDIQRGDVLRARNAWGANMLGLADVGHSALVVRADDQQLELYYGTSGTLAPLTRTVGWGRVSMLLRDGHVGCEGRVVLDKEAPRDSR